MPLYETVVIARNDVTQQQVETIVDSLTAQMDTDRGIEPGAEGTVVKKREYWGLRGLAYRIKKNRKGHYMLLGLEAAPAAMNEMERQLSINEDVLRDMTVRVEELDLELSPVLARRDRDRETRGDREGGDRPPRREFDDIPA